LGEKNDGIIEGLKKQQGEMSGYASEALRIE